MNRAVKQYRFQRSIARATILCFVLAVFVMSVPGRRLGRMDTPTQGPSAAQVNAFKADAAAYKQGILQLVTMQDDLKKDWSPLCNAACIRTGLDQGAALAAIIKQKYPNIENPSWANNFDDKVGDWRRLAEGREQIVRDYLNDKVGALVRTKAKQLDKDRGNLSTLTGYALPADFDDREKHTLRSRKSSLQCSPWLE